jgi:drug/metabolite transporter (DMT)-like permease
MELWVVITVAAAFLQNFRSALQKHLKSRLSTTSATFVRFGFGVPFAIAFLVILYFGAGQDLPSANGSFIFWASLGAVAQIAATFLLVHIFSFHNFVVGTAYSRTEPVQAGIFGFLFLAELPDAHAMVAILVTVLGVMLISVAQKRGNPLMLLGTIFNRTAGIGIASGTLFGLAAVAIRSASLALGGPGFLMQAAFTLAYVILFQSILMLAWIILFEREQLARILQAWRWSLATGLFGATASLGWFAAMTLQQAALVKAVAQIEIVFTIIASLVVFREKINLRELSGTALIVGGILLLLLS